MPVTAMQAVTKFGNSAKAVLAVGCAAFGGIPGARGNPTGATGVQNVVSQAPIINLPGCPVHPDWIVGTIAQLLSGKTPALDRNGRPKMFYGAKIHNNCPRQGTNKVTELGMVGCQVNLGCHGPETYANCYLSHWNRGRTAAGLAVGGTWCIGANTPCSGCTEPEFPDSAWPLLA